MHRVPGLLPKPLSRVSSRCTDLRILPVPVGEDLGFLDLIGKQEKWLQEHKGRINAVMIGVGAAFEFHAGTIRRAPRWMQRFGLEWFFRLAREPRRLWKRYLVTNFVFIARLARQSLRRNA